MVFAALTLLATPALAAPKVDPAAVVAAERAFAADGLKLGIKASFLKHSAPDAVIFRPQPVNAHAYYEAQESDAGGPPLVWWPLLAGISRAGDFGYTTGPFTYDGKPGGSYFTVWKKQADGGWKWVYDGGPPADMSAAAPQGATPVYLPVSTVKRKYPEAAFGGVKAAEAKLAEAAKRDVKAAYAQALADDARVGGSRAAPLDTPAGHEAELGKRAAQITFTPLGGEAAKSGDLAWTYGAAAWADGSGHYVRIWQLRKAGWRIVYDALLVTRKPA